MAAKPFRVSESPNKSGGESMKPAPPPGKFIVQSRQSGDPLPLSEATPDHEPYIKWPPSVAVDHKPMKGMK